MPTVLEYCEKYFGSRDLYNILKLEKTASESEVKKAYKKLSLVVHPDRVSEEEKENATEKFKVLGKIHTILSDSEKRSIYDETGCVDEEDDVDLKEKDWDQYWRLLFKEITIEDISNYEKQYKGSEEEVRDIIKAYNKGKGDMDVLYDMVPFMTLTEESRIIKLIKDLIKKGDLLPFDIFLNEDPKKKNRRTKKLEKEAKEAEEAQKEMEKKKTRKSGGSGADLAAESMVQAILKRKAEREAQADAFFNHLAAKYANGNKKSKKNKNKK